MSQKSNVILFKRFRGAGSKGAKPLKGTEMENVICFPPFFIASLNGTENSFPLLSLVNGYFGGVNLTVLFSKF